MKTESHLSRRKFMEIGAMAAASIMSGLPGEASPVSRVQRKIALQLWTVRDLLEKDYQGTIDRVAEMGFLAVESIPPPEGMSLKEAGQIIRGAGLEVCAAHIELPDGGKHNWQEVAEAFDCDQMVWHGWPEDPRYKTEAGTLELVDLYHDALKICQDSGWSFGLHNHWWEYVQQAGGKYPYQILLDQLDQEVFFEVDTYWVKVAGLDPVKVMGEVGSRAKMSHIKDGMAKSSDSEKEPMVAVGKGVQDFPGILEKAGPNLEWLIVELDHCATDMMTAVRESYQYLVGRGLAEGKVDITR